MTAALECLTQHGACEECFEPVNDQGTGGWIHTRTGTYTCPGSTTTAHAVTEYDREERDAVTRETTRAELYAELRKALTSRTAKSALAVAWQDMQ